MKDTKVDFSLQTETCLLKSLLCLIQTFTHQILFKHKSNEQILINLDLSALHTP